MGRSDTFPLADIQITSPSNGVAWLSFDSNIIRWDSSGAGSAVDIFYRRNASSPWVVVATNAYNQDGSNSLPWVVPQDPSRDAQVRIESIRDRANLWVASDKFVLAGVLVTSPNNAEIVDMGAKLSSSGVRRRSAASRRLTSPTTVILRIRLLPRLTV